MASEAGLGCCPRPPAQAGWRSPATRLSRNCPSQDTERSGPERGVAGVPTPETTAPPEGRWGFSPADSPLPQGRWTRGAPPPGRLSPEAPPSAAPREAAVLSFRTGFRRPRPQRPLPRAAKRPQTLPRKGPAPNPSPGPRPLPAVRSGPPTGRAHDDSSSRPTCSRSSLPGPTRSPSQAGPRQPAPSARVWLRLRLPPGFTRIRDRELV